MSIKVGNKIFLRVFTVFGSLVVVMSLVIALMIIPWQQKALQQIMYTQAVTVAQAIVQACSDAMLSEDYSFIVEHNVEVLDNNPIILYVMISPLESGQIWIEPKSWKLLDISDSQFKEFEETEDNFHFDSLNNEVPVYHFVYPVRFSGIEWGWLHIGFSTRQHDEYVSNMYRHLYIIAGSSILTILLIGYFFARWITHPVATISHLANQVSKGDLSVRSEILRNDEMGLLSDSFNQMVFSLRESKNHLEHYNEQLEQEVAKRCQQLDELNQSLDQRVKNEVAQRQRQEELLIHQSRLAAMGEMIGAIAHQWRQPLNALGLVMQNIEMTYRLGKLDDAFMSRSIEKSERLISKMSSTIDDFRNFFKPNKHSENFCLNASISSVIELIEASLKDHKITLDLDCNKDICVKGYPGEFSQVMLNLLNNAKDTLTERKVANPEIKICVNKRTNNWVVIKVSDNAGGIPEDIIHKIYDPYFSTRAEGKGTGIGLYMSKTIIENSMHGRLKAYNETNGAAFIIELPEKPDFEFRQETLI